ncbi:MAG: DNA cytosine methyltransferase, partial [Saprospiraceae bacterium]
MEMSQNHHGFPTKTFAEFFAGIGLMRLGLEKAGWKIAFANDIDPTKESIYRKHFQDSENHFHLGDIHDLKGSQVPNVSLATASFPCTDLSLAGRRQGLSGSQSSAFWGFVNVLEDMADRRPPIVLLENVEGFLTSRNGQDFKEALLALNELGYSVDAFIIDAVRFVPQSRVRLFVVGHQNVRKPEIVNEKQLSFYQSDLRHSKLADFILRHPEINWTIRNLPNLPTSSSRLMDIIEEIPETSNDWWNEERVKYLLNQTFDRHRVLIETAKAGIGYTYFTAFRRVREGRSMAEIRSDGIAGCLRTPKGGSARQILLR